MKQIGLKKNKIRQIITVIFVFLLIASILIIFYETEPERPTIPLIWNQTTKVRLTQVKATSSDITQSYSVPDLTGSIDHVLDKNYVFYLKREEDASGSFTGFTNLYRYDRKSAETVVLTRLSDFDGSYDRLYLTEDQLYWWREKNQGMVSSQNAVMQYNSKTKEVRTILEQRGTIPFDFYPFGQRLYWIVTQEHRADTIIVLCGEDGVRWELSKELCENLEINRQIDGFTGYIVDGKIYRYDLKNAEISQIIETDCMDGVLTDFYTNEKYGVWLYWENGSSATPTAVFYDYTLKKGYQLDNEITGWDKARGVINGNFLYCVNGTEKFTLVLPT